MRGVTGLRVADASVMPAITSASTNAPTVMIASARRRFGSGRLDVAWSPSLRAEDPGRLAFERYQTKPNLGTERLKPQSACGECNGSD